VHRLTKPQFLGQTMHINAESIESYGDNLLLEKGWFALNEFRREILKNCS